MDHHGHALAAGQRAVHAAEEETHDTRSPRRHVIAVQAAPADSMLDAALCRVILGCS